MTRAELLVASSKGILFSTPMVQAILEDRKSRTMRVMKPQPYPWCWVYELERLMPDV